MVKQDGRTGHQSDGRSQRSRRDSDQPTSLEREPPLSLEERIQNLVTEMHDCLQNNRPINLSTPPHREITEALYRLVYEPGDSGQLKVIYNDSSVGQPFPVRRLWLPDAGLTWDWSRSLNVGTLTFRHVDYDDLVDVYLVRDRETRSLNNAGIEAKAYEQMTCVLSDPCLRDESYVAVFQTGLEPLVVGLYRAVVDHLAFRQLEAWGQLVVQPVFYVKHGKPETGTLWG